MVVAYLANTAAVKDKAQHAVILDKATSDRLYKDVQSYRLITVATLVDRLKINGSLARRCLADLEEKGQIKKVVGHSKLSIYSMLIPSRLVYSVYSQSTQGLPLTTQQLVRSLRRNKGPFTASLRDHDRSPFGIEGTVEWAGVGLCTGFGTFGVAYPIELLLNCTPRPNRTIVIEETIELRGV
jgi:small subunit ribosomal protein S25e